MTLTAYNSELSDASFAKKKARRWRLRQELSGHIECAARCGRVGREGHQGSRCRACTLCAFGVADAEPVCR
ncbi:MAG TPA: hypothetical protein IAA42_05255 [Candidatus Olsenella excrementavium]|uniref:Uncharacterized protein n=1 Tax=Candidatus Olsenella excrementavium TaxID=2838709 RepID=A0A9D1ZBT9_9ACTN|nr:hypothetical protein [Candidatus Olsenella excrementavium]